jgi:uncharacterized protein
MHIQLEGPERHSIQSYDSHQIQINSQIYNQHFIVSPLEIATALPIHNLYDLNQHGFPLLMKYQPEMVLIGYEKPQQLYHSELMNQCLEKNIGVECMSIGATCRTYNVLLSEGRLVVALFLFGSLR